MFVPFLALNHQASKYKVCLFLRGVTALSAFVKVMELHMEIKCAH